MVSPGRVFEKCLFPYGNQWPIKHCQAQMCYDVSRRVMCTNLQLNTSRNAFVTKVGWCKQCNSIM